MSDHRLDLEERDIASWVRRETVSGRILTRAHYVQSVIEGGAITYCGLRMRRASGRPFRVVRCDDDPCANCPPADCDEQLRVYSTFDPSRTVTGSTTIGSTTIGTAHTITVSDGVTWNSGFEPDTDPVPSE